MLYRKDVTIPASLDRSTWLNLHTVRRETFQDEDDTVSVTVEFPDGCQMDIKCCGSQDESSWTEAVLFDRTGRQLAFTEPCYEFLGEWSLEHGGNEYVVNVGVKPEDKSKQAPVMLLLGPDKTAGAVMWPVDYHVCGDVATDVLADSATSFCQDDPDYYAGKDRTVTVRDMLDDMPNFHHRRFGFCLYRPSLLLDGNERDETPDRDRDAAAAALSQALLDSVRCVHVPDGLVLVSDEDIPDAD